VNCDTASSAGPGTLSFVDALLRHNANRGKTAAFLGINQSTLWRKMKKYHIE
jgi:transcriptional regulator with PAS, ATPase and Fis domain